MLCYGGVLTSQFYSALTAVEKVQRRATIKVDNNDPRRSVLQRAVNIALDLLPLTYDREIRDLVFLFKSVFGYIA
jgi:hypothetical protein